MATTSTCVIHERSTDTSHHITLDTMSPKDSQADDVASTEPTGAFSVMERWNNPRINAYRTFATFFSFLVMGSNDAAYGVSDS